MKKVFLRIAHIINYCLIVSQVLAQYSNKQVVILFKNPCTVDASFKSTKSGGLSKDHLINLIYDNSNDFIESKKNKVNEPIKVEPRGKYIVARHYLNYMDFNDYLFQTNDSVLISYQNKMPTVSVLNRSTKQHDFDAEDIFKKRFKFNEYSPLGKYSQAIFLFVRKLFNDPKMLKEQSKLTRQQILERNANAVTQIKKELYNECKSYLRGYDLFLDSLSVGNLMSEVPYQFNKEKVRNLALILEVENGKLTAEETQKIFAQYKVNSFGYPEYYHREFILSIRDKYILPQAKYLKLDDDRNKDPRDVYALIKNSSVFSEQDKTYLMSREINRIAQLMPKSDFQAYFKLFEQDAKDSVLVNETRERFFLQLQEESTEKTALILMNGQKKKVSFDEIRAANKGKIIFVDFWASWCAPCRAAFPESAKLRTRLKDKNVVFVYLSIDKIFEDWAKANKKEGLTEYANSYLVANVKDASFMKQQKIDAIPRYMIFDKTGKLLYPNAPKVESPELQALLIKLTNQ